jgi:hypothetical protein
MIYSLGIYGVLDLALHRHTYNILVGCLWRATHKPIIIINKNEYKNIFGDLGGLWMTPTLGGIPVAGYPAYDTSIMVSTLYTVFMGG